MKKSNVANKINQLHLEVVDGLRTTLEKAIQIGELLTEQKSRLNHGEWLPWIRENLSFSQPTVFNYTKLYESRSKLLNVNNLTEAYRLLKSSKPKQIEHKKSLSEILSNLRNAHLHLKEADEARYDFYFTGDRLLAYNYFYVSIPYQTDFKVAVNGYTFYKVVSEIKEEPVLKIENDQLKITSKSIRASLNTRSGIRFETPLRKINKFTPYENIKDENWKNLPEDFIEGVRKCYFLIEPTVKLSLYHRFNYLSVDGNMMISSDLGNHRISRYEMKGEMDKCCIRLRILRNLLKFETVFKFYQIVDGWLFFKDEFEMIFGGDVEPDFNYGDPSEFFDFETIAEFDLPRIPTREIFMMKLFASGDYDIDRAIDVIFHKNKLILQATDDEKGKIEREYAIKYEGEKVHFLVNPTYLSEAIPYSSHCKVGEDKVLLSSESYEHLISLYKKKWYVEKYNPWTFLGEGMEEEIEKIKNPFKET